MEKLNLVKSNFEQLPNNIEAEQALLGSILVSNEIFDDISPIINSNNFFDPMHQKIFSAIENLILSGMLANPITLKNFFENEKDDLNIPDYLIKITKFSSSSRQTIEYSKLIYDLFVKRELIKISENLSYTAKSNDLDKDGKTIIEDTEKTLFDLAEKGNFNSSLMKFDEAMKQTIEMASNAYKNEEGIVGVPTGLTDLDGRLGGLHKSDLVIIAGRPSMGKTAFATNIAYNISKEKGVNKDKIDKNVLFFSLEMSSDQLATRIMSEISQISSEGIRTGNLSKNDFNKIIAASDNLKKLSLFIDDSPALTISSIRTRARRLKRKMGLDLIVIDYLQLISSESRNLNDNRVKEISDITRGLKAIAKDLNIPVVALSQLSRKVEDREDKRPQLADLRESGSIEQDADVVMFVYREAYYLERKEPRPATVEHAEWQAKMNEVSNLAEIIISKQRHGPTGNLMLEFEAMYTKFKDIQNT